MKDKIFMLVIGMLIGAIITAAGFLVFGNKGKKDFDPSKFNNGERPSFSGEKGDFDPSNYDPNNRPEKPNNQNNTGESQSNE